jgi:tetratricopeptide (TPR) repeat protein
MTESDVQRLTAEAQQALEKEEYADAEELQRRAVELLEKESAEVKRVADELEKLAGIHYQQAKFGVAATEYNRVLKAREASLPATDDRVLRVLYWLGKSHFSDMKYDSAEAAYRRALVAAENSQDSPLNVGRFLCELGFVLYFVGRYREAEPYLLKALGIYEKLHGESHPDTVWVLERLALDYKHCPEIGKDPEPFFRRAAQALNPDEHKAEYASNVCRWAECLADAQRFDEADEVYGRLLPLIDESPEWRSEWNWILSNCVEYFKSRGKGELVAHLAAKDEEYDAYGELTRQRLEHAERTLPDNDPELAEALFNAGNHAIFHHKYAEAEALLRRALDSNIKAYGEVSEPVVTTLNRLCVVARELGNSEKAEEHIQRALDIAKTNFPNSEVYPRTLESISFLRETQGRTDEAISIYAEAVAIFERQSGLASYETIECLYRQSGQLLRAGKFADAEKAIRRVVGKMGEVEGVSGFEKADYVATLASALEGLGRTQEAEETRKRADELLERARKEAEADDSSD